jgi:hypothetical protein
MSVSISAMMFIASGSPKRALNSIALSPSGVRKKPELSTPENDRPASRQPASTAVISSHASR